MRYNGKKPRKNLLQRTRTDVKDQSSRTEFRVQRTMLFWHTVFSYQLSIVNNPSYLKSNSIEENFVLRGKVPGYKSIWAKNYFS